MNSAFWIDRMVELASDPWLFPAIQLLLVAFVAVAFVLVVVMWTGIKVWVSIARGRRLRRAWRQPARRADGRPYPP